MSPVLDRVQFAVKENKGEKVMENNRASFGSNLGFLMAAVCLAVGLGKFGASEDGYERRLRLPARFTPVLAVLSRPRRYDRRVDNRP